MTSPALAFNLQGRGRHYPWPPCDISGWKTRKYGTTEVVHPSNVPGGITPFPSVTNVLSVLHKNLVGYGGEHAIRALYEADERPDDVEQAVEMFKWAANRHRDQRADEGTRAHTIAERLTIDAPIVGDLTDADEAFADAFMAFWTDYNPHPVLTETTVAHPDVGYAGTADLYATLHGSNMDPGVVPGLLTVIDYKTRDADPSEKATAKKLEKYGLLYESNRLQLAALAYGTHRCQPSGSDLMDPVTQALGVVLFSNGEYRVEVIDAAGLDAGFEAFCACLNVWRWMKGAAA